MVSVALRVAFKSGADVLNKPEVGAVLPLGGGHVRAPGRQSLPRRLVCRRGTEATQPQRVSEMTGLT